MSHTTTRQYVRAAVITLTILLGVFLVTFMIAFYPWAAAALFAICLISYEYAVVLDIIKEHTIESELKLDRTI